MSGLVISAGSTQADMDTDQEVGAESGPVHGCVVEFPGREPPPKTGVFNVAVLRRLSDLLLLPADMLHPQERAFAVDLIHSALDAVDSDARCQLSQRLARAGKVAPSLVARLVRDRDLSVAQPLLSHGTAVSDQDLIEIIREGSPDRADLIAARSPLAAEVAGEIAATAPSAAVCTVLRNAGADLTPATVSRIAVRARTDPSLAELLLRRPEMDPACALELFWSVGSHLRAYILKRFLAEGRMVWRILDGEGDTGQMPEQAHGGPGTSRRGVLQSRLKVIADDFAHGGFEEAAADIAKLGNVSLSTARRLVRDRGGEGMTVAMKAAGATRSTFANAIDLWRHSETPVVDEPETMDGLIDLFERLSRGHAIMAMTYWDWRGAARGPYINHLPIASVLTDMET